VAQANLFPATLSAEHDAQHDRRQDQQQQPAPEGRKVVPVAHPRSGIRARLPGEFLLGDAERPGWLGIQLVTLLPTVAVPSVLLMAIPVLPVTVLPVTVVPVQ